MLKEIYENTIKEDLSYFPDIRDKTLKMFYEICELKQYNTKTIIHYTLDQIDCMRYLTGERCGLLRHYFVFVDGKKEIEISTKKLKKAIENKRFFHPVSRKLVKDFEAHIFMKAKLSKIGVMMLDDLNVKGEEL